MKHIGPINSCGDCPFMRQCRDTISAEPWFANRYYCAHHKQGQMVYVDPGYVSCGCPLPDAAVLLDCSEG